MPRKPSPKTLAAIAAAGLMLPVDASARPRLVPGPIAGTAAVIGGLSLAGVGLAVMRARACRADPACAPSRTRVPPVQGPGWPGVREGMPAP